MTATATQGRGGGGEGEAGSNLGDQELLSQGMTHIPKEDDEELRRRSSPRSYSVIERLTAVSTQLESAVELFSTLQVQRTAAQSTISAFESQGTALEGLVQAQCQP